LCSIFVLFEGNKYPTRLVKWRYAHLTWTSHLRDSF